MVRQSKLHPDRCFIADVQNKIVAADRHYDYFKQGNRYCFKKQSLINQEGQPLKTERINVKKIIGLTLFGVKSLSKDFILIEDSGQFVLESNKERKRRQLKIYHTSPKGVEAIKKASDKSYQNNKEEQKRKARERYSEIKSDDNLYKQHQEKQKQYREENKEEFNAASREYNKRHRKRLTALERKRRADMKENNPVKYAKFKARRNIRNRINTVIKNRDLTKKCNNGKFEEMAGCSVKDFYNHIESKFTKGMSWENYGEWHIDHIRPVESWGDKIVEEGIVSEINHYKNLQPLWAVENLRKGKIWRK